VSCIQQGLSVEQAGALMTAAPKQAAGATAFASAMAGVGNPDVKAGAGKDVDLENDPKAIAASWDKVFGVEAKTPVRH
jgi:hypothetical protein